MQTVDSSQESASERELNFAKLSQEDVEFKRKILDLHRKLSHVDDGRGSSGSPSKNQDSNYERLEAISTTIKSSVTQNEVEQNLETNSNESRSEKQSLKEYQSQNQSESELENPRKADERNTEANFGNHWMIRRRSMKLLSFLSGRSSDRSQEERAAKLLKMYMPVEKETRPQNTISIHHTSRDRRFWKLRSRRRSSSA